jgi:hypothetical protein
MAFNFTLKPPVDSLDQANIFAELIHGTNAVLNWRCIHGANKSIEQLRGSLAESKETLSNLNGRGFNIFMTFNQTDGKGVKGSNIIAISGLFADLDGAPFISMT